MKSALVRITDYIWELPVLFKRGMKVPVRVFASEKLINEMEDVVFAQAANVASLPGLVDYVVVLPDAHSGYGAPIGCVFATDLQRKGVISPGAVGYDINCGMRLIATNLTENEVKPRIEKLIGLLFDYVPPGVGREGFLKATYNDLDQIAVKGASWMVEKGYGWLSDLANTEEKGQLKGANPDKVSQKAKERGKLQLATLGSGNHYLEVQKVVKILNKPVSSSFGINQPGQVMVMLHCGSRGFGHQIATDYLKIFESKLEKYKIKINDLQLACAPFDSIDGQSYHQAMTAAANFAYANRQAITFQVREVFEKVFGKKGDDLGMKVIYDVSHNTAKMEERIENNKQIKGENKQNKKMLLVHRKGATRSFPNQPVIIGGSMESGSYLLMGTDTALNLTFGSTAHGSGRVMSRHQAKKKLQGKQLAKRMLNEGIYVKSASWAGLAEETGLAYKNIADVVESVDQVSLAKPIVAFSPLGNIKG